MMCVLILALLSITIICGLLISIATGVCVNNLSCRAIHAEIYRRGDCAGLFGINSCFSKKVNTNSKECCDSKNKDCWRSGSSADDALYWIDCDTDKRTKQGYGQTVVACATCVITITDSGLIVVTDEKGEQRTRAMQACKF